MVALVVGSYSVYITLWERLWRKEQGMHRVVVADDQSEYLEWLRALLERCNKFQVVGEAISGKEALSLVRQLMPDLVIADIEMPDQDGLDVARYISQNLPQIKVVLISSHAEREYERLASEEGATAFIPKMSLTLEVLCEALRMEA